MDILYIRDTYYTDYYTTRCCFVSPTGFNRGNPGGTASAAVTPGGGSCLDLEGGISLLLGYSPLFVEEKRVYFQNMVRLFEYI